MRCTWIITQVDQTDHGAFTVLEYDMRCLQLTAPGLDHLELIDLPAPRPGPNEVLVQMEAAALNYRDVLAATGRLYTDMPLPLIPVSDGAGTVLEVGAKVRRFRPGDRVTTVYKPHWLGGRMRPEWQGAEPGGPNPGAMRELACFDPYALARAPQHLSAVQAATLPCAALTAWHVLQQGALTTGQTVLVIGTGGVSLFALQFAKLRGARVAVVSSSDAKLDRARALGADIAINYRQVPGWGEAMREATGGIGVDMVVETAGAATLAQSIAATRMHGYIGLVGFIGGIEATLPLQQAMLGRICLQGIAVASLEEYERMLEAVNYTALQPVLDRVFGFAELGDALAYLAEGRHFGKVGIDFAL